MWLAPSLRVKYGPYFRLDPAEQLATVNLAQAALGHGAGLVDAPPLVTRRTAIEMIAPTFGIENVDAAMDALEQEAADDQKAALEKMKATQAIMGTAPAPGEPKGPPKQEPKE